MTCVCPLTISNTSNVLSDKSYCQLQRTGSFTADLSSWPAEAAETPILLHASLMRGTFQHVYQEYESVLKGFVFKSMTFKWTFIIDLL